MSHETYLYPISTGSLTLPGDSANLVREEEGEYRVFSRVLTDYTDLVNEKLPKVRAVALMLRNAEALPPGGMEEVGALIADLVDDVMLAHKAMWAEYRRRQE